MTRTSHPRSLLRLFVLLLALATLGACHFHGHCGSYSWCAPVRYCR